MRCRPYLTLSCYKKSWTHRDTRYQKNFNDFEMVKFHHNYFEWNALKFLWFSIHWIICNYEEWVKFNVLISKIPCLETLSKNYHQIYMHKLHGSLTIVHGITFSLYKISLSYKIQIKWKSHFQGVLNMSNINNTSSWWIWCRKRNLIESQFCKSSFPISWPQPSIIEVNNLPIFVHLNV